MESFWRPNSRPLDGRFARGRGGNGADAGSHGPQFLKKNFCIGALTMAAAMGYNGFAFSCDEPRVCPSADSE